ncbi:hypothetical protein RhiirA4_541542 [Rhizophagus irregularis]|uniref:RZ-type domain-containing protein n=1 Tax=Rhizophagus irregularis TaxID=588596 RepID=A0A2I1GBM3_9GLOM|nr:hypothetical protein RhiirA4_541542 [Rhizophagus irregularis]
MRCLALIPIESDVLLSFYKKLFSNEPFPLMGAIIERIFIKEDVENEGIFFTILTDFEEAVRQSARLNLINKCFGDLDTNMATLCCDTIEQSFFMNEKLENFAAFFGPALEALYKQGRPPLQKIVSIAFLKEFVRRFWDTSREWRHSEVQSADFLTKELTGINLSNSFKTIATNILSNKQPLLQIVNPEINNTDLFIKSVISHIFAFHALVEPNSSQLAMYLHNIQNCQNMFILTCMSDVVSMVLNAIPEVKTRYSCKCGYIYIVAECGNVVQAGKCPNCGSTIGGTTYNKPETGNTRLDAGPVHQIAVNDQSGYIGETVNQDLYHSVRSLTPTSYRMLHLIIHVLIGASAPQPALAFLQKNNKVALDSEKYCMDHIQNDWDVLKKLLNCSDANLALAFHSLISLMMEKPLPNQQINTSAERTNWETMFHNNYIAPLTKNINETATNYRMKLDEALTKNKKERLE